MFARHCIIGDSSNVSEILYDLKNQVMKIVFKTGSEYEYLSVNPQEFGKVIGAISVGSYINAYIKTNYKSRKIK